MNKVIAAAGLSVLSATFVQAQYAPGLTPLETSKPWSLSTSVRGFYDDNYLTLPKSYPIPGGTGHALGSWGTEVTPGAAVNHSDENTLFSASYLFDYQWYAQSSTSYESHQFKGNLQHEFSDRYKLSVNESFVVAQEPTVIDEAITSNPLRVNGNNIRNTGQLDFTASLTKEFDLHLGYGNTVYAYQQITRSVVGYPFVGPESAYVPTPSYSDLLDRMEQLATVDLRWKATPETTGVVGYQYGHTDYTSPGYIIYPDSGLGGTGPYFLPTLPPGSPLNTVGYRSNIRNSDSHFGFIGADESITPELNASVRVGAEYIDYYNYDTSRVSPYVDASLTYQYMPGDSAQLGVKHVHNTTDVTGFAGTTPVLDEESTAIYLSDTHKITEKLSVTAMGQAQLSTFVGGGPSYDGKEEDFYILQINFAYRFNPWLTGEAGYNYSKLNSPLLVRSYTRDVMYLGLRAVY